MSVRAICPCCDEDIGLCAGEVTSPMKHDHEFAWFRCHQCGSCWSVTPALAPRPSEDDA